MDNLILDTSSFGLSKVFSCLVCDQKFTNKLKIALHWSINHSYDLCPLCSNYAFKNESDRLDHERQHVPFGCSSCEHEFTTVCHETISAHYKNEHSSFLCNYCSSVIEPYSKHQEHIEKRHNVISFSNIVNDLFELTGSETKFFNCKMCNKKKPINLLFGHYAFYHNLSIQSMKQYISKIPEIRIDGSQLNDSDLEEGGRDTCSVCDNPVSPETTTKEIHEVFCQGFVACNLKDCNQLFEDKKKLAEHLDVDHLPDSCRFGCRETYLKPREISDHLHNLHDIVECYLCNIVNSSGNFKNHLRDKHSVNLMTYEKALSKATTKLYRVESSRRKKQVLCNFCDLDITQDIRQFSFIEHYRGHHEINIAAIIQNLGKNPIIDVILNDKKMKTDEECLKNFTVIQTDSIGSIKDFIETDFDASKVYCIGYDSHLELKHQIFDTDELTTSLISCDFCKKTFDVSCRLYEHLTESHGFRLLNVEDTCNTCHVDILKNEKHIDEDNKTFNLSLVCPLDDSYHVTKDNFKNHLKLEHRDPESSTDRILYKCLECQFTYKSMTEVRVHFAAMHPDTKMSYCSICRYKLNDPSHDTDHFNKNHSENLKQIETFCCKLCKKQFSKKNAARSHYENFHKEKELKKKLAFKCQLCNDGFLSTEDRKMHQMVAHPNDRLHTCKSCPLKFATKSGLSSHNLIHRNVMNTCEHCKKQFIRRDSYKEHLLIHSGVRQKCSFCTKTFVQRSNLIRHERIHLNEKPYKCNFCEKTFSDKGACNSHMKVHTKSEHSNCSVCGKHFARKQKLKYHMRIHTMKDILTCDICNKIFTESYSYRKHKETHLKKGRNDQCHICMKILKSKKAKEKHMMNYHSDMFPEPESLIETRIRCSVCNGNDFTRATIKDHLSSVHKIDESNNWESYVGEVEFEMDIGEQQMIAHD